MRALAVEFTVLIIEPRIILVKRRPALSAGVHADAERVLDTCFQCKLWDLGRVVLDRPRRPASA